MQILFVIELIIDHDPVGFLCGPSAQASHLRMHAWSSSIFSLEVTSRSALSFCSKLCEFFPWECPLLVPCLCPPFSLSPCFPFLGLLPSAYGASFVIFLKKVIFFLFPNTITFQGTKSRTFAYESRIGGRNSAHHRDTRDRDSMCQTNHRPCPAVVGCDMQASSSLVSTVTSTMVPTKHLLQGPHTRQT